MGKKKKVPFKTQLGSNSTTTATTAANFAAQSGETVEIQRGEVKVTVKPGDLPADVESRITKKEQKAAARRNTN